MKISWKSFLLVTLTAFGSCSEGNRSKYAELENPVTLNFYHNLDHVTLIKCFLSTLEVFSWYPKISNTGTFTGTLQNRAQFVQGTNSLLIIINSMQVADEGPYKCEFVNTPANAKVTDEVYLGLYSKPKYNIVIKPQPGADNIINQFINETVEIDIKSDCGRPEMKFTVTSSRGLQAASVAQACDLQKFLGHTSLLHLAVRVTAVQQLSIRVDHPSVSSGPLNYQVQLIDLCTKQPCKNNGSCVGDSKSYTCKCEEQYVGQHCEYLIPASVPDKQKAPPIVCRASTAGNNFGFVVLGVFLTLLVVTFVWLVKDYKRYKRSDDGREEVDMVPQKKKNVKTYMMRRTSEIVAATKDGPCYHRDRRNKQLTNSTKRDQHRLSSQEMRLLKAAAEHNKSAASYADRQDSEAPMRTPGRLSSDGGDSSFDDEEFTPPGGPRPPRVQHLKGEGGTNLMRKESAVYANLPIKRKAADPKDVDEKTMSAEQRESKNTEAKPTDEAVQNDTESEPAGAKTAEKPLHADSSDKNTTEPADSLKEQPGMVQVRVEGTPIADSDSSLQQEGPSFTTFKADIHT